mmetsp:Transcript_84338/g.243820  ORF Transcript_84338/g.243820 Transcript_84338/m.243820 type:complete len:261 (-) Transcript_84338:1207-1989(-)
MSATSGRSAASLGEMRTAGGAPGPEGAEDASKPSAANAAASQSGLYKATYSWLAAQKTTQTSSFSAISPLFKPPTTSPRSATDSNLRAATLGNAPSPACGASGTPSLNCRSMDQASSACGAATSPLCPPAAVLIGSALSPRSSSNAGGATTSENAGNAICGGASAHRNLNSGDAVTAAIFSKLLRQDDCNAGNLASELKQRSSRIASSNARKLCDKVASSMCCNRSIHARRLPTGRGSRTARSTTTWRTSDMIRDMLCET